VFLVMFGGCASLPATQEPTIEPAVTSQPPAATPASESTPASPRPAAVPTPTETEIESGVQRALDLYIKAYNQNKPDLLRQAVDQVNLPFRRFVQTEFDNAQKSFLASQGWSRLKVKSIKQRDLGFVQAQIETVNGWVADWYFRRVGDRWVISEPTSKQIGE